MRGWCQGPQGWVERTQGESKSEGACKGGSEVKCGEVMSREPEVGHFRKVQRSVMTETVPSLDEAKSTLGS